MKNKKCPKKIKIIVTTQYYENYNTENPKSAPHWKSKGGYDFSFMIDFDNWMYDDERIKACVTKIIAAENNAMQKFDIVHWETVLNEPQDISDQVETMYNAEIGSLQS